MWGYFCVGVLPREVPKTGARDIPTMTGLQPGTETDPLHHLTWVRCPDLDQGKSGLNVEHLFK